MASGASSSRRHQLVDGDFDENATKTSGQKTKAKTPLAMATEHQFKICQQYLGLRSMLASGMLNLLDFTFCMN
jgi:hypothetical protein